MPGKRREPSASEPPGSETAGGGTRDGERLGPIVIARHVKDDGRALILYSREDADAR
jgi:hypothetical protein